MDKVVYIASPLSGNVEETWISQGGPASTPLAINPGMFGFCKDADGEIAIDEEQATAIRMIFQAYLDGDSLTAIKHRHLHPGVVRPCAGRSGPAQGQARHQRESTEPSGWQI